MGGDNDGDHNMVIDGDHNMVIVAVTMVTTIMMVIRMVR